MIPLSLAAIAEITGASLGAGTDPGAVADSVVIDSRKAGPGSLFAALPGENADGHDFAAAAIRVSGLRPGDMIALVSRLHPGSHKRSRRTVCAPGSAGKRPIRRSCSGKRLFESISP